jgi:hypothetical protein
MVNDRNGEAGNFAANGFDDEENQTRARNTTTNNQNVSYWLNDFAIKRHK